MRQGTHIITPNKKMNSGPLARYRQLKDHQRTSFIHYFYEGTVGAGGAPAGPAPAGPARCRLGCCLGWLGGARGGRRCPLPASRHMQGHRAGRCWWPAAACVRRG
jgi:hypothetical protein